MLASHKNEDPIGQFKVHLSRVDSTNNYAANLLKSGKAQPGTVILADEQTNGRGQRGTRWQSEPGMNLQFSTIWMPENMDVAQQRYINFAISISIKNYLAKIGIEAQIKWPNDILVNKNKICGVLVENQLVGQTIKSCIIGIGLNVNQCDFKNISATSLRLENKIFYPILDVLDGLVFCINEQLDLLNAFKYKELQESYLTHLYGYNAEFSFTHENKVQLGKIKGVSEDGEIQIETEGKVKTFGLKEIKFLF